MVKRPGSSSSRGERRPPPPGQDGPQGRSASGALTDPSLPILPRPFRLRLLPGSLRTGRGHEEDVMDASPSSSRSLPVTTSFSKMVSREGPQRHSPFRLGAWARPPTPASPARFPLPGLQPRPCSTSPGLTMYLHLLAASFPNLTLGGRKRQASAGLRRVAQAADDPAAASQPLATPAAGGGQPAGAGAAEQGLPGTHAPPPSPAARSRAGSPPPLRCHSPRPGSRRRGIINSNPEGKPWEAGQLSSQHQALEERDVIRNDSCLSPALGGEIPGSRFRLLAGSQRASSQRATLQQPSCLRGHPPAPKVFLSSRAGAQGWAALGTELSLCWAQTRTASRVPARRPASCSRGEQTCARLGGSAAPGRARTFSGQGRR